MKTILEKIKQMRESKHYSQEYVAEKLGMQQSSYGLIENGKRSLRYEQLVQIAMIFNCDVIDIITYPKKYVDSDLLGNPEKISVTFEVSPDKRDILLSLVTKKE